MSVEEDAGQILEYLYLQDEPVSQQTLFDASDLSEDEIRTALDELEERLLVEIGLTSNDAPYDDISITEKGADTIETGGAFSEAFGSPLDLNEIAQEWSAD